MLRFSLLKNSSLGSSSSALCNTRQCLYNMSIASECWPVEHHPPLPFKLASKGLHIQTGPLLILHATPQCSMWDIFRAPILHLTIAVSLTACNVPEMPQCERLGRKYCSLESNSSSTRIETSVPEPAHSYEVKILCGAIWQPNSQLSRELQSY
jgi:hypothetical protein